MKKTNESYENFVVTKVVNLCKARLKAMSMPVSYSFHFQQPDDYLIQHEICKSCNHFIKVFSVYKDRSKVLSI